LALEKEMISAPSRLEQAAHQLGLEPATAGQIARSDSYRPTNSKTEVTEPKTSVKKASTR
jgi:hypothetical protein